MFLAAIPRHVFHTMTPHGVHSREAKMLVYMYILIKKF